MFGFWAHFAAQNRAFRSNLLRCASQIPLQSLAFDSQLPVPPPARDSRIFIVNCSVPCYFSLFPFSFFLFTRNARSVKQLSK
jgi:hypothetical protein